MQSNTQEYHLNSHLLTFTQLCDCCELSAETLTEMINYAVIVPSAITITEHEALYETECIQKVRKAARLCRDLELNMPGAALALDLLDEINTLRERSLIVH